MGRRNKNYKQHSQQRKHSSNVRNFNFAKAVEHTNKKTYGKLKLTPVESYKVLDVAKGIFGDKRYYVCSTQEDLNG